MRLPEIIKIHSSETRLEKSFSEAAAAFRDITGTSLLLSGGESSAAEYNILAVKPWLTLTSKNGETSVSGSVTRENPFDTLKKILEKYHFSTPHFPVSSGLFGYIGYEAGKNSEKLPLTTIDDLLLPDIFLCAASVICVENRKTGLTTIHITETDSSNEKPSETMDWFMESVKNSQYSPLNGFSAGKVRSCFSQQSYEKAVCEIKEHILNGEVYQVNLSQRFEADFKGDAFEFFNVLFKKNPAPFFAYINAGDHRIVSTSPERFISRNGMKIETRPIKGTRPRSCIEKEDTKLRQELSESIKDDAELTMIVDLMRNDFGKVAVPGSVKVSCHKNMESYDNVHHLVSTVNAGLPPCYNSSDFIRAVFPAGSITGCPKIKSMETIDALEPVNRHIYTGSAGYISFHDTMDLSVAIRTCTIKNNRIYFSAGGGIVADSDPSEEYMETLHKAGTITGILEKSGQDTEKKYLMWLNGFFVDDSEPFMGAMDSGLVSGKGFFETILSRNEKIYFLEDHIKRFEKAWKRIIRLPMPYICWMDVIKKTLRRNMLDKAEARIKIMAFTKSGFAGYTICVTTRPYIHRLKAGNKTGVDLVSVTGCLKNNFSEYKTTNRLFHNTAAEQASEKNADEALFIDSEGYVLETDTANIILLKNKNIFIPEKKGRLSGVMEKNILKILSEWNFRIEEKKIRLEFFFDCDVVFMTNSLVGAVAVLSVDGKKLKTDPDFLQRINSTL